MLLSSEKVQLRPISESDTANIVKWRNSDSVLSWFFIRELLTEESHTKWLQNFVQTGKVAQFIIVDKQSGLDIGSTFLKDIDTVNLKAEFGIFIGEPSALGKGFGTEATSLIINYGFEHLKLHRITLRVFSDNQRAISAYKKAGFVTEGVLKEDIHVGDEFKDITIMASIKN